MSYWLTTPHGEYPLPRTLRPQKLAHTARTLSLQRARGYPDVYDLADNLPDPVPVILQGPIVRDPHGGMFRTEEELSRYLAELEQALMTATAINREGREPVPLTLTSFVDAAPLGNGHSCWADVTITLVPAKVRTPGQLRAFFW